MTLALIDILLDHWRVHPIGQTGYVAGWWWWG